MHSIKNWPEVGEPQNLLQADFSLAYLRRRLTMESHAVVGKVIGLLALLSSARAVLPCINAQLQELCIQAWLLLSQSWALVFRS